MHSGMTDDETSNAEKKGVAYLYLLFALLTLGAVLYIHFKVWHVCLFTVCNVWRLLACTGFQVPETKGKTPEQLRDMAEGKDRNVPFGDNVLGTLVWCSTICWTHVLLMSCIRVYVCVCRNVHSVI